MHLRDQFSKSSCFRGHLFQRLKIFFRSHHLRGFAKVALIVLEKLLWLPSEKIVKIFLRKQKLWKSTPECFELASPIFVQSCRRAFLAQWKALSATNEISIIENKKQKSFWATCCWLKTHWLIKAWQKFLFRRPSFSALGNFSQKVWICSVFSVSLLKGN